MSQLIRSEVGALQTLNETQLVERLEEAATAIEGARTIVEAKNIRAGVQAMNTWIKARKFSAETVRKAQAVQLRTDFHFGRLLKQQQKNRGGWPDRSCGSKKEPQDKPPTLAQQGIDKKDAMHCQQLAALDESQVGEIISEAIAAGQKLSVTRAVKLATKRTRKPKPPAPDLPSACFGVIYADPPWQTDFERGDSRDVEKHYPTMPLDAIASLGVDRLADKDCVLFLWATSPMLPQALEVMKRWGFTYKSSAVWAKSGIGMGYYFRQDHELLLIGTKGKPGAPEPQNRSSSVVSADKGRHSEKPAVFYEIIERMYPDARRLELFAREGDRPGWTFWGNEATDDPISPLSPV